MRTLGFDYDSLQKSRGLKDLGLTDIEWKLYKALPLYNFKYDGEEIENYCRALAAILDKENVLEIAQLKDIEIAIEILPSVALNPWDHPGLKISVDGKVEIDDIMTTVECFTGFLLSIERKLEFSEADILYANGVILPLFLTNYSHEVFVDGIINFFELLFASTLYPLELQPLHLKWILALWSSPENHNYDTVYLSYKYPSADLSKIELFWDKKALSDVWRLATQSNITNEISNEQVFEFSAELEEMFFKMFKIFLADFNLSMLTLSKITVATGSSVSFPQCTELYWFLRLLTHFCQELRIT